MLLGDYAEVEQWIEEGRVDCGFLSLPTRLEFETISLKMDEYQVEIRSLTEPYYREIGLAVKSRERLTSAAAKFLEYLDFREKR